jgi:hypothetical protein
MKVERSQINGIIQWIIIIGLSITCLFTCSRNNKFIHSIETNTNKENTYVKVYESQEINRLKKINKALFDSIKHLKDVESVVQVKYKYVYNTDTVFVEKEEPDWLKQIKDSVYNISSETDSISYNLKINAKYLKWYQLDFKLKDEFLLVNREKDGINELMVKLGLGGSTIENVTAVHRKNNTFWDRFSIGPSVTFGYDMVNRNIGCTVGVGISFNFKK